jgi:protein-tyrosine-phosphatase
MDLLNIASEIHKNKIKYFLQFDKTTNNLEVPDPYYEKIDAFYKVFGILKTASDAIVEFLKSLK